MGGTASTAPPQDCTPERKVRLANGSCVDRITEYFVGGEPGNIAIDTNGAIWFEDKAANEIVQIDTNGNALIVIQLNSGEGERALIRGSGDVALWFTDSFSRGLIKVTAENIIGYELGNHLVGLALGPNDNVWVAEMGRALHEVTRDGMLVKSWEATPSNAVVAGPDGNLWYADQGRQAIARMTPGGETSYFPVSDGLPNDLCVGPDNAIWYTDGTSNQIGRMELNGSYRTFELPVGSSPYRIVAGRDRALWFTERSLPAVGRIGVDGTITHYPVADANPLPYGITVANDGTLWFTLRFAGKIGRLLPDLPRSP